MNNYLAQQVAYKQQVLIQMAELESQISSHRKTIKAMKALVKATDRIIKSEKK